jgi:exodeoxyribonuclease V alpha subunit
MQVASMVRSMSGTRPGYPAIEMDRAIAWWEQRQKIQLAPSQRQALHQVCEHRLLVITGGPGVGKTTILRAVLQILAAKKVRFLLCAPTGRAAKRMSEATGFEARTIHRLLEFQPGGGFARGEGNPLETDLVVVDESSMLDIGLASRLMGACPRGGSLILVGDVDQLPSVGPGRVFGDLIESGIVAVVRLTEVFRQASASRIISAAHAINQGSMPSLPEPGEASDFYFVERDEPAAVAATLANLVKNRIPGRLGCDPILDVQVLSPMHRGALGVRELNLALQNALNPRSEGNDFIEKFGCEFRVGDKVMQTENNYDKEVFNGDIGVVARVDSIERFVVVRYGAREVNYDFGELDEVELAYAITIHKSQGSEFPAVVIPVTTQHFMMLRRNLIYTAVTRGRRFVVLVGQRKALALAIRNSEVGRRYSGLVDRLRAS